MSGLVRYSQNWIDSVLCDSFPASDPPSWTPIATTATPAAADIHESDRSKLRRLLRTSNL